MKPLLKQFAALTPQDFDVHPAWVSCHSVDYDERWYDETNEETFRPWAGALPLNGEEMYLVSAALTFADGTNFKGFVTPTDWGEPFSIEMLRSIQPQVFSPQGKRFAFWFGMFERPEEIPIFYAEFKKAPSEVFPIQFSCRPGLTSVVSNGKIPGFCSQKDEFKISK